MMGCIKRALIILKERVLVAEPSPEMEAYINRVLRRQVPEIPLYGKEADFQPTGPDKGWVIVDWGENSNKLYFVERTPGGFSVLDKGFIDR